MKKILIVIILSLSFILTGCGRSNDSRGETNPFIQDVNHLETMMSENFALFDVVYWARGVNLPGLFENLRAEIRENPDMNENQFFAALQENLAPINAAHFLIERPAEHVAHTGVNLSATADQLRQLPDNERERLQHTVRAILEAFEQEFYADELDTYLARGDYEAASAALASITAWVTDLGEDGIIAIQMAFLTTTTNDEFNDMVLQFREMLLMSNQQEMADSLLVYAALGDFRRIAEMANYANDNWHIWALQQQTTTSIIEPGRIALLEMPAMSAPDHTLHQVRMMEFLAEIYGYEHLIIDISQNIGGFSHFFTRDILSIIMQRTTRVEAFCFFIEGYYSENHLNVIFRPQLSRDFYFYDLAPRPIDQILEAHDLPEFHAPDAARLTHGLRANYHLHAPLFSFRWRDVNFFDGKVWLMISENSLSAATLAAWVSRETGFATLVGEPTGGHYGGARDYTTLPNSGVRITMDLFYVTDSRGRPLEAGGLPHHFTREGMTIFETVLALIEEGNYE